MPDKLAARVRYRYLLSVLFSCYKHTHTQIGRGPLSQTASTPNANKDTSLGRPDNKTTTKFQPVRRIFFQSGSEPRAHIVCEMFPHGKEKKIQQKIQIFPLSSPNIPVRCIRSRLRNGIVNGKKSGNKKGNAKEER
jgi:hypothetical protein